MVRQGFLVSALLLLLSSFIVFPSFAQSENPLLDQTSPEETTLTEESEILDESIDYELAYPGMLPDNPLYFLKTIRDAVVRFLIRDPLKEAEFNVMTANKRAYAALFLSEKGNHELMLATLSKSTNYLHDALDSLSKAKEGEENIMPILDNVKKSVKKHEQIFSQQILPNTPANMKDSLEKELLRLKDVEKSANNLAS